MSPLCLHDIQSNEANRLFSRGYNATLILNPNGEWEMESLTLLPEEFHPQISPEELIECEEVVKNNPQIQKLAKDVGEYPSRIYRG